MRVKKPHLNTRDPEGLSMIISQDGGKNNVASILNNDVVRCVIL